MYRFYQKVWTNLNIPATYKDAAFPIVAILGIQFLKILQI